MDSSASLRVVSLNIHGWRDKHGKLNRWRILEELQRRNADVIALQEVKTPFPISKAKNAQEEIEKERIITICHQGRTTVVGFDISMSQQELHDTICQQLGFPSVTDFVLTQRDSLESLSSLSQLCEDKFCDYRRRPTRYDLQLIGPPPKASPKNVDQLSFLASGLDMEFSFQPALDETFGNALLWKKSLGITTVTSLTVKIGATEARSVVQITVPLCGVPMSIFNTHLDVEKEEIRLQQAHVFLTLVNSTQPHILVGDLNALRQADYSDTRLREIVATRTQAKIEAPHFDLLKNLEEKHHYQCGIPFSATCEYGTRIDYVLLSEECRKQFTISDTQTISTEATDHALIMITLAKKQ